MFVLGVRGDAFFGDLNGYTQECHGGGVDVGCGERAEDRNLGR